MPIRDLNGNIVKLSGPNPLMKDQEFWDKKKLKYINLKWDSIVVVDQKKTIVDKLEEFYEPPKPQQEVPVEPKNIVVIPKASEAPKTPERPKLDSRLARMIDEKKIVFHCLPVIVTKDDFYGGERKSYGKKFTTEGIIVNEGDFEMTFWVEMKLENGAIIYPTSLNKRWWKVTGTKEQSGGYMTQTIVSDINPDFSD